MKKHETHSITFTLSAIDTVVDRLMPFSKDCPIFTFTGSLGAGKTTLVRQLLRKLGVTEGVTSPTYTYMNIYQNKLGQKFFHFDLYRVSSLDEFMAAGFDEYLNQENSYVFIEWPEHVLPLVGRQACNVVLEYVDEDTRTCTYTVPAEK